MIFPAIDLQGGQSVRLFKGDFQKRTLIAASPQEQVARFEQAQVGCLHLVDLDGAKFGRPPPPPLMLEAIDLIRSPALTPVLTESSLTATIRFALLPLPVPSTKISDKFFARQVSARLRS